MHIPEAFKKTILRTFSDKGNDWLSRLPALLEQCCKRWGLEILQPIDGLSFNYITLVKSRTGEILILKIGVPHPELYTEMAALDIYAGRHCVKLIDADQDLGAMLMQRITPGLRLCDFSTNKEQTRIAGLLIQALPKPVTNNHVIPQYGTLLTKAFKRLRKTYGPTCGPMPVEQIELAEYLFKEMVKKSSHLVMLHGDLHHENILYDEHCGWLAIDPKGICGPACLEVGRFMFNQLKEGTPLQEVRTLIEERIMILSELLHIERDMILASTIIDQTLSLCWCLEDAYVENDWYDALEIARMIGNMV